MRELQDRSGYSADPIASNGGKTPAGGHASAASADRLKSQPASPLATDLADLLTRIAASQDQSAFSELFVRFGPIVKGMLMRQGVDAASAEEIVQDTFLTVWRKAALFAPERGAATTWIFTIARNLRIDRFRRETPWQELSDEWCQVASEAPPQDDQLAAKQIQQRMEGVVSTLPAEQMQIVRLAYVQGLSQGEISAQLGLPLGTVKSRMRLAYQKIRALFQEVQ